MYDSIKMVGFLLLSQFITVGDDVFQSDTHCIRRNVRRNE